MEHWNLPAEKGALVWISKSVLPLKIHKNQISLENYTIIECLKKISNFKKGGEGALYQFLLYGRPNFSNLFVRKLSNCTCQNELFN